VDNAGRGVARTGTFSAVSQIRVQPDVVRSQAGRYGDVVARVGSARDELLLVLASCEGALGREVQETMRELRWSVQHGLDVLEHDHRQLQAGLQAVAECFRELDEGLFR
jgi:hypothetical protein